jgi:hypothetical protein
MAVVMGGGHGSENIPGLGSGRKSVPLPQFRTANADGRLKEEAPWTNLMTGSTA